MTEISGMISKFISMQLNGEEDGTKRGMQNYKQKNGLRIAV